MIRKGSKVKFRPIHWSDNVNGFLIGKILWVHPKKRFYLIEYAGQARPITKKIPKIRECVRLEQIKELNKC